MRVSKGASFSAAFFPIPTQRHIKSINQSAALHLFQGRVIFLGMSAPHLTGNVLVRGDRSSLLVGTDGKDGRADAEDTDVSDGRVALPGGWGIPPAAVGRPNLIFEGHCRGQRCLD